MPDISLIIPTLNEEGTIGECIKGAREAFRTLDMDGEILVVDSSSDKTGAIASDLGATVIRSEQLGYGNAYLTGFAKAEGRYIVLMDGDLTYDPSEIPSFIHSLEDGADFVIGSRLKGNIRPGAMPLLHRYVGNPLLTGILNLLFRSGISDAHCGMRAIRRDALKRINLRTGGMEFASEMVIEASRKGLRIDEVPITYSSRHGMSKLSSFSDGWRHLRFMMLYRPGPFLMLPGSIALIMGLALAGTVTAMGGSNEIRMHSLILGSLLLIIGYQTLLAGLHFSAFGVAYGLGTGRIGKLLSYHSLGKELIFGFILLTAGLVLGASVLMSWMRSGMGSLYEVQSAMMALILSILGIQTIFSGMFISLLLLGNGDRESRDLT